MRSCRSAPNTDARTVAEPPIVFVSCNHGLFSVFIFPFVLTRNAKAQTQPLSRSRSLISRSERHYRDDHWSRSSMSAAAGTTQHTVQIHYMKQTRARCTAVGLLLVAGGLYTPRPLQRLLVGARSLQRELLSLLCFASRLLLRCHFNLLVGGVCGATVSSLDRAVRPLSAHLMVSRNQPLVCVWRGRWTHECPLGCPVCRCGLTAWLRTHPFDNQVCLVCLPVTPIVLSSSLGLGREPPLARKRTGGASERMSSARLTSGQSDGDRQTPF